MSNLTKIKRTIQALQYAYDMQQIAKADIIKALNNDNFQSAYVNY
jgi:hypothetical protein